MKRIILLIITFALAFLSFGCEKLSTGYDAGYLEKKLLLPYIIAGSLTAAPVGARDGVTGQETYDIVISAGEYEALSGNDFKIEFKSGDVTEGLTVEFFEDGVFISFDDLRFKTNSNLFTRLEMLKNAFSRFSQAHIEKKREDIDSSLGGNISGVELTEISADGDGIKYRALINQKDGALLRLTAESESEKLVLNIKQFETIAEPFEKELTTSSAEE